MDQPWVKHWFPRLATRLTYWPLDSGDVRRFLQLAGRGDLLDFARDVEAKPHRALADVELHVAEARRYVSLLQSIPTPSSEVGGDSCGPLEPGDEALPVADGASDPAEPRMMGSREDDLGVEDWRQPVVGG